MFVMVAPTTTLWGLSDVNMKLDGDHYGE